MFGWGLLEDTVCSNNRRGNGRRGEGGGGGLQDAVFSMSPVKLKTCSNNVLVNATRV